MTHIVLFKTYGLDDIIILYTPPAPSPLQQPSDYRVSIYRAAQGGEFYQIGWWGSVVYGTLHRAEGQYGWVRCRGYFTVYMRDSLLKS